MAKNKLSPSELDNDIYLLTARYKLHIILIILSLSTIGLLTNFPVKKNIALLVSNAINKNRACPISFERIDVSFFLPSITIKDTIVSGSCFNKPNQQLALNDVKLLFYGPSFSPLGVKFKSEINKGRTKLNVFISVGFNSQSIRLKESTIDTTILNKFSGNKLSLGGKLDIDAVFNIKKLKLYSGNIFLKSKDFYIPPQQVLLGQLPLEIPHLPIENVILKARITPKSSNVSDLQIVAFEIGSNNSPILGEIKGPIKLNKSIIQSSELSLSGKVKFSKLFIESFGFINLYIAGKNVDKDGFYKLSVDGLFAKPQFKFF